MKRPSPRLWSGGPMAARSGRAAASTSGFNGDEHGDDRRNYGKPGRFRDHDRLVLELVFQLELEHRQHAGRKLPDLPAAPDDAIAEPEPARSAGHQSIHPAARPIRRRRAAAQDQRSTHPAGLAAANYASDP